MLQVPTWLILIVAIAFIIVFAVLIREYKRYVLAVKAVQALAAGTQISFNQLTEAVNGMIDTMNGLIMSDKVQDAALDALEYTLNAHQEVLTTSLLTEISNKRERIKIGAAEDSNGSVQGP